MSVVDLIQRHILGNAFIFVSSVNKFRNLANSVLFAVKCMRNIIFRSHVPITNSVARRWRPCGLRRAANRPAG